MCQTTEHPDTDGSSGIAAEHSRNRQIGRLRRHMRQCECLTFNGRRAQLGVDNLEDVAATVGGSQLEIRVALSGQWYSRPLNSIQIQSETLSLTGSDEWRRCAQGN